jgi:O-methyltransferase
MTQTISGPAEPHDATEPPALYLDLLKRVLSFSLWPEPPIPITRQPYKRSWLKAQVVRGATALAASRGWQIVEPSPYTEEQRAEGKLWPQYADTMIGLKRLDNIHSCVEDVLRRHVPGDLIETGVWRGGGSILMRAVLKAHGSTERRVFVADSFKGFPPEDGMPEYINTACTVSRQAVEANFRKYGLLDDQVVFLEGWFKDTLPSAPIDRLAIMRLDGDLYSSTMDALNALYPKLSVGGYCIIDDYDIEGCRQAVDEFRRHHGISSTLNVIDFTGRYWQRTNDTLPRSSPA